MILDYGDVNRIQATHWFMVELRSERTCEETTKRVGRSLKEVFGSEPCQVFVPVIERDLDTFTLLTESYIFIRSDNPTKIGKLRKITGVQAIMAKDDSTRVTKFIQVEDDYVQGLIKQCWEAHYKRSTNIGLGTWVRILDGETRDMCGNVVAIIGDRVVVKIDMKTKPVMVETSLTNLLDLSHVPEAHRVFYYSTPVRQFLEDAGTDAEEAIKGDLRYDEEEVKAFLGQEELEPPPVAAYTGPSAARTHTSREQTATRLIASLIQGGERDVHVLLAKTVEAIRSKNIKPPKAATILWHVLRQAVIVHMFAGIPEIRTYTDVVTHYGGGFKITPKDVLAAIPELPLRSLGDTTEIVHKPESIPDVPLKPATKPLGKVVEITHKPETLPAFRGVMNTVTGMVRGSLEAGNYDIAQTIAEIGNGIAAGTVRPPKHLDSLSTAVRTQVLRHFRSAHPTSGIKALAEIYGEGLRLSPTSLRERFPHLESEIALKRASQFKFLRAIEG